MVALGAIFSVGMASTSPFRIDEAMAGYADTPENRKAMAKLFNEAKPKINKELPPDFDFGTKGICAPSQMERELDKMYKGPPKSPIDKYWDAMLKR